MMLTVWVFVVTFAMAGAPVVVEFGPYPTREVCQADRDAFELRGVSFGWSKTVCFIRAAGGRRPQGGDARPWGSPTEPVLRGPGGRSGPL